MECDAKNELQVNHDDPAVLFDRLGGEKAIGAVVYKFYELMLTN